jgi:mono/diheme cytochrome c family protein
MRAALFVGAVAASLLAAAPLRAQQFNPNALPDGEGREVVAAACSTCHPAVAFTRLREGSDAWRAQVYDMILRGAQVAPDEVDTVVSYLATHFGPGINVPQGRPTTLPDGAGKDLVAAQCSVCHALDRVTAAKRSPAAWKDVLARMKFFGASYSPEEETAIAGYLDTQFGAKSDTASR